MIFYKTNDEVELIRQSSLLVSKTLAEIAKIIKPGISTLALDKTAEEFIRDHGGEPAFKNYRKYPATLCTSINEEVVHGIPAQNRILNEGDIVSVDCGVLKNGFYGDSAFTFEVGEVDPNVHDLLKITKESLYIGIENAVEGKRLGDIGFSIQQYCEHYGYGVVRDLVGHGIGKNLHEKPEVPNYGKRGSGLMLQDGLVIAIEPMINIGTKGTRIMADGWTIISADKSPSAHFEHTVVVRKDKADILSTFDYIQEVLQQLSVSSY